MDVIIQNTYDLTYIKNSAAIRELTKVEKAYGAGGRTRTDTVLPPRDFESRASANFATPALINNGIITRKFVNFGLSINLYYV